MKNLSMFAVLFLSFTIFISPLMAQIPAFPGAAGMAQIPAFPGAEGYGSTTPGGRGGQVLFVDNLNDTGPGSLRAACLTPGPRIVVFRTGGIIELKDHIVITEPFLTIAGQTAPGDGVALKNAGIQILTHDVIIRGLRLRPGDSTSGADPRLRDGIWIGEQSDLGARNVIIDHCSVSWAIDENLSVAGASTDVTVQWCLIAEGLMNSLHPKGGHSMGLLVGNGTARRVSLHHNLLAHNNNRNPRIADGSEAEIINNLIYNWGKVATVLEGSTANLIANLYLPGPDTDLNSQRQDGLIRREVDAIPDASASHVYLLDNIGPNRPDNSGEQTLVLSGQPGDVVVSDAPVFPSSGVTVQEVARLEALLLEHVGALVPRRDAVDLRILNDVRNRQGRIIDSPAQVGGYPSMTAGTPPQDRDNDGMPDDWETANGLNPNDPTDANGDADGDGYTNIEEYINGLLSISIRR